MAATLDRQFFRKVTRRRRTLEFTANEVILPAVKDEPEIRVALPNRRERTIDERIEILAERTANVTLLDEEIETERKKLAEIVRRYKAGQAAVSEVVILNESVRGLMERRSTLARPDTWIEGDDTLTYKDIFMRERDLKKLKWEVFMLKRRVEPISSLYVDVVVPVVQGAAAPSAAPAPIAPAAAPVAPVAPAAGQAPATGAIIGRRVLKLKKTATAASAAASKAAGL
uniref:Uncharacterized protein n=1 Tax=viral metagenome TaxID=1070528 RepID=A0A6C0KC14_9ZZZZ